MNSIKIDKGTFCRLTRPDMKPSGILFSLFKDSTEAMIAEDIEQVKDWLPVLVSAKLIDGITTDDPDRETIVWIQSFSI